MRGKQLHDEAEKHVEKRWLTVQIDDAFRKAVLKEIHVEKLPPLIQGTDVETQPHMPVNNS